MKAINCILIAIFLSASTIQAQEVIATAGSHGETTSGSLSWTIGEPLIETITDGTKTLTQGFHQSKLTVTAINDLKVSPIELSVYPNPTSSFISIELKTDKQKDLLLSLFDLNGRIILRKKMTESRETIKMQKYKPATYILKVSEGNKEIQTYQIVKY